MATTPSPAPRPYRVMTVCTGNICRSPMAEIVLRDRFESAGLGADVVVDSTGISDEERGNPVDPRARRTLQAAGYAVPQHRARRVTAADLADRDLVLAMTSGHLRSLERLLPAATRADGARTPELRMYRSFDPAAPAGVPDHQLDVDDPWYGPDAAFEDTLAEIEAAADAIVDHVRAALAR